MWEILNKEGIVIATVPTLDNVDTVYKGHEYREVVISISEPIELVSNNIDLVSFTNVITGA